MSRWSIPIERLAQRSTARIETVARRAALQIYRSVVLKSPVDTGRFIANWNVSYGTPNYEITASTDTARATQEVNKVLGMEVGGVWFLSNGLPYARRLEYGYSSKAPSGMVRISVQEFEDHVRRALA